MQVFDAIKFLRIAAVPVISIFIGVPAFVSAPAQAKPSTATAPAAPAVQLTPYTSQDQSVSAGVPSGWTVKNAMGGQINMAGPQGQTINFGDVYIAHDGPFQLGQKGPGAALMSMPSSAKLTDKLAMFIEQQESLMGSSAAQVKVNYAAPLQSLPAGVQCGVFVIAISGIATPADGMGVFCSLADDSAQMFKIVLLMGTAPAAIAAQTVPTVAAVYKSYKIAPGWVQKMLAPYTASASASAVQGAAGSAAETQMFLQAMANQQAVIDHGFTCADAGIIGPSNWQTAAQCGYLTPF